MSKTLRIIITILITVSILTVFLISRSLAATTPSITGTVINGTSGEPISGLDIILVTFVETKSSGMQKAVTDNNGNYQFNGLSTNTTYAYRVHVTYKDVQYASNIIQLTDSTPTQTANLNVFETTSSSATVKNSGGHVIIAPDSPGIINVLEVWRFNNSGNQTYIGGESDHVTVRFSLPPEAFHFSADTSVSVDNVTGIVTDTLPMIPGTNSIVFSYSLPYQGNEALVTKKFDYVTPNFSILVPQKGIVAKSTTLTQSAPQDFQGTTYLVFTGTNLDAGQTVNLALTISPAVFSASAPSNTTSPESKTWQLVLAVILVLAVGFSIIYPIARRRNVATAGEASGRVERTDIEEAILIQRIAQLDDKFDAGEIDEKEYRERRAKEKARLVAIRSRSKDN